MINGELLCLLECPVQQIQKLKKKRGNRNVLLVQPFMFDNLEMAQCTNVDFAIIYHFIDKIGGKVAKASKQGLTRSRFRLIL